jgi:signal transduction histidine kinase
LGNLSKKTIWKLLFFTGAVIIGLSSLIYTNRLVKDLSVEERKKVELWAKATRMLITMQGDEIGFDLLFGLIENNNTVPVVLANSSMDTLTTRNLDKNRLKNPGYLKRQLERMKAEHEPITIHLGEKEIYYIYYRDSILLTRLQYFPFIQLAVVLLFVAVAYVAFSASRRAEQNQVWVGLTRETAHQLGTPTSSLLAWLELFRMKRADADTLLELEKDVKRLEKIADRFSKIGSRPVLEKANLMEVIEGAVQYIKNRASDKAQFVIHAPDNRQVFASLNPGLFEWVVENLCRNSIDAMSGSGTVEITVSEHGKKIFVDVGDRGKGIAKKLYKTIFRPGYTSKPRGWGLGLSLSRRIIENYHKGKIYVLHSEPGKGTVMRIQLRKLEE